MKWGLWWWHQGCACSGLSEMSGKQLGVMMSSVVPGVYWFLELIWLRSQDRSRVGLAVSWVWRMCWLSVMVLIDWQSCDTEILKPNGGDNKGLGVVDRPVVGYAECFSWIRVVCCINETGSQWWQQGYTCSVSSRIFQLDPSQMLYQWNRVVVVTVSVCL